MAIKTIYRKDYTPPSFEIESINLNIDLFDDNAIITNEMLIKKHSGKSIELLGEQITLLELKINDKLLNEKNYKIKKNSLIINTDLKNFKLTIKNKIKPQENTELSGLYCSNNIFCTQCEAEGFRRITYFPDRPDVLTIYTTRITADKTKFPILLSNGNKIFSEDLGNGRHSATWHDPFKKPSYLFALVAGDLQFVEDTFVTAENNEVILRIYVEKGNEDKCDYAMKSLKQAMRWDEEQFGRIYDLDIYMIVAVSDFNMGAMENKGLNIFNAKYILASPKTATDQDYQDIQGVIGHEYFHNWSGNRVTCRDWFQLSLKEGLTIFRDQEFSRKMNSKDVFRIQDVKMLRNIQFPEDAGSMAHPVRPESYQEINNFYTATIYNKGAEVIRMQQTILGNAGFRKGMDLYFARNDGKAVTIDDFVQAMQDANKIDLTQFKLWYSQAGTPIVKVDSSYKNNQLAITLEQSCRATTEKKKIEPFHIPIRFALFDELGNKLKIENDILHLKEKKQTFIFDDIQAKPIISLLRDFSAPIILEQKLTNQELKLLLMAEDDGFAKFNAGLTIAIDCVRNFYKTGQKSWQLPDDLINAFEYIIADQKIEKALKAEILTPPGFEDIVIGLEQVDVMKVENARDYFRDNLGNSLFKRLKQIYLDLQNEEDNKISKIAFNRRKLKNICLMYLMKANEDKSLDFCLEQFYKAENMTDSFYSFNLLANAKNTDVRKKAIGAFYDNWKDDDLVLDKWFMVQATSDTPDSLENVKTLLGHPAFNITNPNKCRALIGAFCMGNYRHFHSADGKGYEFLTQMLLKVDKINPQVAARLATPFTRWQKLDSKRQKLIQRQLKLLSETNLSKDVAELINKSLLMN